VAAETLQPGRQADGLAVALLQGDRGSCFWEVLDRAYGELAQYMQHDIA
jgi:hypothetical protein